jgi:hypothetical protein
MFRYSLVILLLIAFLVENFYQSLLVVDYYINPQSFAVQCENKSKPQLHCNGHCLLMKKMKKEENKDKQNPERKGNNKNEIVFFCQTHTNTAYHARQLKQNFISFNNSSTHDLSFSFFHPPKV